MIRHWHSFISMYPQHTFAFWNCSVGLLFWKILKNWRRKSNIILSKKSRRDGKVIEHVNKLFPFSSKSSEACHWYQTIQESYKQCRDIFVLYTPRDIYSLRIWCTCPRGGSGKKKVIYIISHHWNRTIQLFTYSAIKFVNILFLFVQWKLLNCYS